MLDWKEISKQVVSSHSEKDVLRFAVKALVHESAGLKTALAEGNLGMAGSRAAALEFPLLLLTALDEKKNGKEPVNTLS